MAYRYYDDRVGDTLLYFQGQYYKMQQMQYSPRYDFFNFLMDTFGPWRLPTRIPKTMDYWRDLDYRYRDTMRRYLNSTGTHFHTGEITTQVDMSLSPIGTKVEINWNPIVTVMFGDTKHNYSVEIHRDEVYHIDYMHNATLESVLGKVIGSRNIEGNDYRGASSNYVILNIDCSEDFNSNIVSIDTRDIRFIMAMKDLQQSTSITRTHIGIEEPDSKHGEFGAWFNPATGEYKILTTDGWKVIPVKPTEEPEEGKQWVYNDKDVVWEQQDIT